MDAEVSTQLVGRGSGPEGYLGLEALHHPWESCGGRMILSLSIHIRNKNHNNTIPHH